MQISIRPYDPGDRETVVDIALRAWEPAHRALERTLGTRLHRQVVGDWRRAHARDVREDLDSEEALAWVAVNDHVSGFVTVRFDREGGTGLVHLLGVDPDQQGRGTGTALTEFAVDRIREEGMAVAVIRTGGDEAHAPARAVYEKAGFVASPVVHYYRSL
ncbi:GNAT family N-acetyltransferase [Nocardiopsis sp. SBT366]|uniref:GNAT family N-acetyltransferase n=1 Tax=Nocardiopsis sp. SBT366 TaxID=1580529 RepID=UPI00066A2439|nr:GNAT family N-acetyltransferase [Nocardiopsis sp. SBT366]